MRPNTIGETVAPKFPKVFMIAEAVPAWWRPRSRATAQETPVVSSIAANASRRKTNENTGESRHSAAGHADSGHAKGRNRHPPAAGSEPSRAPEQAVRNPPPESIRQGAGKKQQPRERTGHQQTGTVLADPVLRHPEQKEGQYETVTSVSQGKHQKAPAGRQGLPGRGGGLARRR